MKRKAVLLVDYQNMHGTAREGNHTFHVVDLVFYVKKMFHLRREDVFVFMSRAFFSSMPENAKAKVLGLRAQLRLTSRTRVQGCFDPVDKAIIKTASKELKRKDIDVLIFASSDGDFAPLGNDAWHRNKECHVVCYTKPSHKLHLAVDSVVELKEIIVPHVRR